MNGYIIENGKLIEAQVGDKVTHIVVRVDDAGITRERLEAALAAKDNWGGMVHAFEFLTACGMLLGAWEET